MLTTEEMNALAVRAQRDGDERDRLFRELHHWIVWAARRYAPRMNQDDAKGEIAVAILEALYSYDPDAGSFRGWALGAIMLRLRTKYRSDMLYQRKCLVVPFQGASAGGGASGAAVPRLRDADGHLVDCVPYTPEDPQIDARSGEDAARFETAHDVAAVLKKAGARLTDRQNAVLSAHIASVPVPGTMARLGITHWAYYEALKQALAALSAIADEELAR